MEQTRLHMEERKGQATLRNSTRMAGLFCSLVCVRLNDVFHPLKDKIHVAF